MNRAKLALVHIVKREIGLSDAAYRRILKAVAGVSSARDLTDEGFRRLMRHLVRSPQYAVNRNGLTLRQKLYMEYLRKALGWDDGHLANFLRKYYGRTGVETLSRGEASKAIVGLRRILASREAPRRCDLADGFRTGSAEPLRVPEASAHG